MDNDIYEVTRDEYVGFVSEIKQECRDVEVSHLEDCTIMKILSKKTGTHFCTRIVPENGEEHYFIFNMPLDEERQAGKPILKIRLESREEVQAFLNALSKISKEKKE